MLAVGWRLCIPAVMSSLTPVSQRSGHRRFLVSFSCAYFWSPLRQVPNLWYSRSWVSISLLILMIVKYVVWILEANCSQNLLLSALPSQVRLTTWEEKAKRACAWRTHTMPCLSSQKLYANGVSHMRTAALQHEGLFEAGILIFPIQQGIYNFVCARHWTTDCALKSGWTGSQVIIAVTHWALAMNKGVCAKSCTYSTLFNLIRGPGCYHLRYHLREKQAERGWVHFLDPSTNKRRH